MERKKLAIGIVLVVVLILMVIFVQFFVLNSLKKKPDIPKAALSEGGEIMPGHVDWMVNELGAYQLGSDAEMEIVVEGKTFAVKVINDRPTATLGNATDPDVRIRAGYAEFLQIYNSPDIISEVAKLYSEGNIQVDLIKDYGTLIVKGYKGIYDNLQTG